MARNDQARWAPLGSEDAPDRWCTKGRRTPLDGQGLWASWVASSRELHCGPRRMRHQLLLCDYWQCLTVTGFGRG